MKKRSGIAIRIIVLICVTVCGLCVVITTVGAKLIYSFTESSVQSEIQNAARTLKRLYDYEFVISTPNSDIINRNNNQKMSMQDFSRLTSMIGCSNDIDFTLFRGDTRIFTSVKNSDGSAAVGTKAEADVSNNVLNSGNEFFNRKVLVNGQFYVGCYIPIESFDGNIVGMCFAGKPLDIATANAIKAIGIFIAVSLGVLLLSLVVCMIYLKSIIYGLSDIKQFITAIANGNFSVKMNDETLRREDEIGDIGQHALKLRENLRDMVERDPLTTLLNRRSCRIKISELEEKSIPYAVVMGDIDFFKNINDEFGHAAGDEVLKAISNYLYNETEKNDGFTSRWGGEEFLCVFPEKDLNYTTKMLDGLMNGIRMSEFKFNNTKIHITMTFGAVVHLEGEDMDSTINRADKLLYKGKQSGRDRYEI